MNDPLFFMRTGNNKKKAVKKLAQNRKQPMSTLITRGTEFGLLALNIDFLSANAFLPLFQPFLSEPCFVFK